MKILDLFAGLRGWSQPFQERGHEVFSIDFDKRFDVDLHKDIMELTESDLPWKPDVILASPPCEGFSVMQIGRNWTHCHQPKTAKAAQALLLVEKTVNLIMDFKPKHFIIENPRAKLRKLPIMQQFERRTVTYCAVASHPRSGCIDPKCSEHRMKPTDLWGGFPPGLELAPICANGDPCHVSAPRGSRTGTQGMDRAESAKIPHALSLQICKAMESAVGQDGQP